MLRYVLATLCISLVAGYSVLDEDFLVLESENEGLSWPEAFTVKATKLSLTSNLMEDFSAWKTNISSRIDYNGGAVKSITILSAIDSEDGFRYEIHPETTDGEEPEVVCNSSPGRRVFLFTTESILPAIEDDDDFETVGNETIVEKETVKFESVSTSSGKEVRKTIWAAFEEIEDIYVWIPVRYEMKTFNTILGALTTHEIWDFFEFDTNVDEDVFDVGEFSCDASSVVKHAADSDTIMKKLMFINPDNEKHVDHIFHNYIAEFQREYAHEQEHIMRRDIFHQNMRLVSSINKKNAGYKLTINQFSDRTPQELERSRGLKRRAPGKTGNIAFPYDGEKLKDAASELPDDFDLRLLDLVTPVKNQESCGSCWTFGTTSAVEGALARINGGRLMRLSNQALVDCVWVYGAAGCDGGTDNAAYDWMMDYGLPTEEEYGTYKNKDGECRIANMTTKYPIRGYTDVTPFSNEATKLAAYKYGPLSVSVHVTKEFSQYSSGIFNQYNCNPLRLNHEVTLVGYGHRDGDLFWILKNSWGTSWGIDGYMLIAAKDNNCGVTTEPTYVVF